MVIIRLCVVCEHDPQHASPGVGLQPCAETSLSHSVPLFPLLCRSSDSRFQTYAGHVHRINIKKSYKPSNLYILGVSEASRAIKNASKTRNAVLFFPGKFFGESQSHSSWPKFCEGPRLKPSEDRGLYWTPTTDPDSNGRLDLPTWMTPFQSHWINYSQSYRHGQGQGFIAGVMGVGTWNGPFKGVWGFVFGNLLKLDIQTWKL